MAGVTRRRFLAGSAALGLSPLLTRLRGVDAAVRARLQVVRVAVSSPAQAHLLDGFDVLCGQRGTQGVDVLLWPGDAARLRRLGLQSTVLVDDVAAAGDDPADYRRLADYEADMRSLAARFPDRARVFTLPERTLEGRPVYAIEIASGVNQPDGRPCFYMDGVHHAREWPSGELSMMFAAELVEGYDTDPRIRGLVDAVRTVVVPVVNADGFEHSRESAVQRAPDASLEGYWRKNRRSPLHDARDAAGSAAPAAPDRPVHPEAYGVDANRNYPHHWGGGGSGDAPADGTYRGLSPCSEPESRNVRWVLSRYPFTALISNHTYSDLIIRPWGETYDDCPDEELMSGLGARMAETNGYSNIKGMQLYATTGTTSDYAYAAFSSLAYTFEHGHAFHPPFEYVLEMYERTLEAFLLAMETAADPAYHGVVSGRVLGSTGMRLRAWINVTKDFTSEAYNVLEPPRERVDIPTQAGDGGRFELHLNPSTRPLAMGEEAYTVVFSAQGYRSEAREVVVGRGERVDLGDVVLRQL